MVRAVVFRLLRLTLLPLLLRETVQRRRITLLLYHDPSPQTFEKHLEVLQRLYRIVSLREVVERLNDGLGRRLPPKSVVLTLDDGHRSNFHLKPLLERLDVPVTIFICSGIVDSRRRFWFKHAQDVTELKALSDEQRVERLREVGFDEDAEWPEREALSKDEILEMARSHVDFQSHTVSHPILPQSSDGKARDEIFRSRSELEDGYGFDVYALSYPNGDYSPREIELAREAGYSCGVTVDLGFNMAGTDPFRLKRICIDENDGIDELIVKASGLWGVISRAARGARYGYRSEPISRTR
jgi:peptidoglycan/xylan/chitin deacetylase (PgdA/CDA1 family)